MFVTVLLLPLLSFVSILLFGSYIGTYGSMLLSCVNISGAFVTSILSFWYLSHDCAMYVDI